MAKFEQMQQALLMLKQLGLPISKEQIEALREGEINLVNKKIVPKVKTTVEKASLDLQNPYNLLVRYDPKKGVEVRVVNVTGNASPVENKSQRQQPPKQDARSEFWKEFVDYCDKHNGLYAGMSRDDHSWLSKSLQRIIKGGAINVVVHRDSCWAELYILGDTPEYSNRIFDELLKYRSEIDSLVPNLEWDRRDNLKSCRIRVVQPYRFTNPQERQKAIEFLYKESMELMAIFSEYGKLIK